MKPSDHPFMGVLGTLGADVAELLEPVNEDGRRLEMRPTRPLKPHEAYTRHVLLAAGELVTTCSQVEQSVIFMSNFRSTPGLKKHKILRLDHVLYHIENHLIRMVSSFDRALILTNEVFRLGNTPRNCKPHIILKNEYVKGTAAAASLKRMNKLIQPYREERNTVVHKQAYTHEDLHPLEAVYFLKKIGENPAPDHWTKRETDEFVATKKQQMTDANAQLFECVCQLLTSLQSDFERIHPKL